MNTLMNTSRNTLITVLLIGLAVSFLGAVTAPALAGPNGITSGETTANALRTDTVPLSPGEMSVGWSDESGATTQYADSGPGTVVTIADTGFDMSVVSPIDVNNEKAVSIGDSVVYTIPVRNLGNNAQPVQFDFEQSDESGTTGSFTWELFEENSGNNSFDSGADRRLSGNAGSIAYAENEIDTIYAVITAKSSANDGDSIQNKLFATDNAPINGPGSNVDGTAGDQWERGTVIGSEDTYDTQNTFYRTQVSGAVLEIAKEFDSSRSSGSFRPGDTVAYRITVTSTGSDTATDVEVVDALPDSTTFTTVDGDNVLNGNNLSATEGDNDTNEPFENDGLNKDTERIKWTIDKIGPGGQSNDSVELTFRVRLN